MLMLIVDHSKCGVRRHDRAWHQAATEVIGTQRRSFLPGSLTAAAALVITTVRFKCAQLPRQ